MPCSVRGRRLMSMLIFSSFFIGFNCCCSVYYSFSHKTCKTFALGRLANRLADGKPLVSGLPIDLPRFCMFCGFCDIISL
jgi:hypothetical protein